MTGNLNSQNVYPTKGSTYNCGSVDRPFHSTCSNYLYSIGSDGKIYARLQATTLGTTTTQGYTDIYIGNGTATGTEGNSKGRILLYNSGSNYAIIQDHDSATTNRTLTLPRSSGQIPVAAVSGTTLNITY